LLPFLRKKPREFVIYGFTNPRNRPATGSSGGINTPQGRDASTVLSANDQSLLSSLQVKFPGVNAVTKNDYVWIGDDGFVKTTFTNNDTNPIILILWAGYNSDFVNEYQPQITYPLATGSSVTVSIAAGVGQGGFSAVYPDTPFGSFGQVNNTWGEFTVAGTDSTIDISRMINMQGHNITVESKTTGCIADMETCAFTCYEGDDNCFLPGKYYLADCQNGINNNYYLDTTTGAVSGGCQMGNGGEVLVTFW
jgi:hypothetical protein